MNKLLRALICQRTVGDRIKLEDFALDRPPLSSVIHICLAVWRCVGSNIRSRFIYSFLHVRGVYLHGGMFF